jgi:hypothetical protein
MQLIQAEIRSGNLYTMVWIPSSLKAKAGTRIQQKNDPRSWEVVNAYTIPREESASDWKLA